MWGYVAAAALPYVVDAVSGDRPGSPAARPVVMPDRSAYADAILQSGFNQDIGAYRQAAEIAQANTNRILAQQGLVGSSIGAQASISQQNQLASQYVEDMLRKRKMAFDTVNQYDLGRAGVEQGNAQMAYQADMAAYNAEMARRNSSMQGIGAIGGAAANYYARQEERDYLAAERQNQRDWMMQLQKPQVYYGTPGYQNPIPQGPVREVPSYYSPYAVS